jgi:WD40 repeat protein
LLFSPDGKLLATVGIPLASAKPAAKIWDTTTYEMVRAPQGHADLVLDVAFAPDSKTLVTCGVDDSIKFWNTDTWQQIPPSLAQREYVNALAVSPNGALLASACGDGRLKLWNIAARHEVASLKLDWAFWYLTFSPDGQTLAVRCWDDTIRLLRGPRWEGD